MKQGRIQLMQAIFLGGIKGYYTLGIANLMNGIRIRAFSLHSRLTSPPLSNCEIDVSDHDALVDDVIKIRVNGLCKRQKITISANLVQGKHTFCSHGCFVADDKGVVDLSEQPSVSGTYKGTSPMGLFWSMRPALGQRKGLRLVKYNASTPFDVDLFVLNGHLGLDDVCRQAGTKLCQQRIRRWYMARGVQRVPVRTGRVRGTLFLPPGEGPFPGVVDLFGPMICLMEFRAALLASRGFATLALAYVKHEDLPKNVDDVDLDYFMEAINWFTAHPDVSNDVGVIGTSKGGQIAHYLAYYSPKVKTVVYINGVVTYDGKDPDPELMENARADFSRSMTTTVSGNIVPENAVETPYGLSMINCWPDIANEGVLPVWETDTTALLIVGEDDHCLDPRVTKRLYDQYPDDKKDNCTLVVYPGAGHLIEPPYSPHSMTTNMEMQEFRAGKFVIFWGGQTELHALAQEDSWRRILEHFRRNLSVGVHAGIRNTF